jgi:hypothetical protein
VLAVQNGLRAPAHAPHGAGLALVDELLHDLVHRVGVVPARAFSSANTMTAPPPKRGGTTWCRAWLMSTGGWLARYTTLPLGLRMV